MAEATAPSIIEHRYLHVADLRRLRHLFFASRGRVEGLYAGRHRSPQRGHSVEFTDYRPYMPGDEVADIDWKVFGRSDRLMIRMFEHQSDMTVHLVVDASASMGYGGVESRESRVARRRNKTGVHDASTRDSRLVTRDSSKFSHACRMAAAVAFLSIKQQDKASLTLAQHGAAAFERPAGSFTHLHNLLRAMEQVEPAGEAKLAEALKQLAAATGRRGLVILLSDLLDDREAIVQSLSAFTHRGSEVIVFHLLHADELNLPDLDDAVFIDSESSQRLKLNVADVRAAYDEKMRAFTQGWSSACRARGIDYNLVSTATPYHQALEHYLFTRAALR